MPHLPQDALYIPNFINSAEAGMFTNMIDGSDWRHDLKRRVQHYGYRYDYRSRSVMDADYLGPIPEWISGINRRLVSEGIFAQLPDQMIVNEYEPGQGIAAHVDCVPCFANTIASLSLGSSCEMVFSHQKSGNKKSVILEANSLLVLCGEARYDWTHSIPARKSDLIDGIRVSRSRRLSLTFRNVMLSD
ncbi:MAG: alpha-ketoglutarate-dependent dioxygenase AlkB [Pseudomonadota bacterium]